MTNQRAVTTKLGSMPPGSIRRPALERVVAVSTEFCGCCVTNCTRRSVDAPVILAVLTGHTGPWSPIPGELKDMSMDATLERVKRVVRDSLKISSDLPMDDQMPLIGGAHDLDSLDALLVVTNIEREFKIKIPDRTVGRQVFSSIRSLADFVERQQP